MGFSTEAVVVRDGGSGDETRGRRRVKARRGPAHLAIDLEAIKGNLHRRGHTDTDSWMDRGISNLEF
ncbi:hypothetical protein PFLUV_G00004220 [Perca fluviatilis]|uniref:Uncharacterized protein n=1 Tax=Perca fluviatilis TaxID=8168 RepID=A0A6A5FQT1_PERFL|nr:hypothetical protein PFLUV_G00004220 [Perca fluviatilis]